MFDADDGAGAGRRIRRWLLLDGNRWVLAAGLAFAVFGFLVVVLHLNDPPLRVTMRQKDPVETLFQGLATALITGVTLVVTIDQLVLSKQLGALGEQRAELADALEFRTEVEELFDATSPGEPAALMSVIVDDSRARAETLVGVAGSRAKGEDALLRRVEEFAAGHAENADAVSRRLDEAEFLRFGVLRAVMEYDYTWRLHEGLRLRRAVEDSGETHIDGELRETFDDLLHALRLFGPAREHIRSLYFQSELVQLSRVILSVAVPALAVTVAALLAIDAGDLPGATLGVSNLVWVVCAAVTVAVVPFLILVSYVLRIVTITQRTLTTGPFILEKADHPESPEP